MKSQIAEHIALISTLPDLEPAMELVGNTLLNGGKLWIAGNGGSACDAEHFAAELCGRFGKERKGLPAMALTNNLTAYANDYGYENVFARQLEAYTRPGDLFIGISTSGKSANIIHALRSAPCKTLTLCGDLHMYSDVCVSIPSTNTARIQEMHIFIIHLICEYVDSLY